MSNFVAAILPLVENALVMALVEPGTLVLVVDDDLDVRCVLADVLAMEGYEVLPFSSAEAAWSAIASGADPALVILDLWLPGMSSREFVRRLRSSRAAAVSVLVLSGDATPQHREPDVDAVAPKPVEATSLVRVVDRLVATRSRAASGPALTRPTPQSV